MVLIFPSNMMPGCSACGHLACVCDIKDKHRPDCKFRISATCPVGIECKHGRDTCPECDPCTCGAEEHRATYR